ncbi:hypothetical protein [Flavobacterium tistrianum]|uniref:hypothetical protein n=1 Tax=Flavobacterium tistrianum TaxID=1685414 RepID=UPI0013A6428D|nr:hypothetical protein [Flavobacterium tistrianum]KAF2343054.1 hypothetical protein DMB71_00545 [Flavobacterium tistrianum]
MKKLFLKNWILICCFFLFMALAILMQGGWALWDYWSAGGRWHNWNVLIDLFLMSLPPIFFICILNVSFFMITSDRILSTIVTAFILMASCLIIDTEIFANRERGLQVYENIWNEGFCLAARPIFITGLIFSYPLFMISRRIAFCTEC